MSCFASLPLWSQIVCAELGAASPLRLLAKMKQHLAGFRHEQDAFVFPVCVIFGPNRLRIAVTKIDFTASLCWDARGQSHLGAALLYAAFKRANPAHMRRMREHTPRIMFEQLPLIQKIIATMVTDLRNRFAMAHAHLRNVRCINDKPPAIRKHRFELVHALPAGPQLV